MLFLFHLILQKKKAFIGLIDRSSNGHRVWQTTANSATYFNWKSGQPDGLGVQDCVLMMTNGQWDDEFCSLVLPFAGETVLYPVICEKLLWV